MIEKNEAGAAREVVPFPPLGAEGEPADGAWAGQMASPFPGNGVPHPGNAEARPWVGEMTASPFPGNGLPHPGNAEARPWVGELGSPFPGSGD